MHAYVHTPLRCVITSTHSHRARSHALHATTSSCAITPTATAYAPHNLHPGGCTGHICNVVPCTYNIHVHMHRDCACACHLHAHLERNARTTERNANKAAQCTIPRCRMRAAARRGSCVKVVHVRYVRSQFYFQFIFILFPCNTVDGRS